MYDKNILSPKDFCGMNYDYFELLSRFSDKRSYHSFIEKVFSASIEMIRRKDKIKVGFVTIDSAQWSGDDLYNLFAADKRFEVTIFDCLRIRVSNSVSCSRSHIGNYNLIRF